MCHDGVHRAFNIGDQAFVGYETWVNAKFDAFFAVDGHTLGDAQKLNAVTQLLGVFDVLRG